MRLLYGRRAAGSAAPQAQHRARAAADAIDNGALVGIVSRADRVRAVAAKAEKPVASTLTERKARDLVRAEFQRLNFGLRSEGSVIVQDGVVHLWGFAPDETERRALRIAVEDHTGRLFTPFGIDPKKPGVVTIVEWAAWTAGLRIDRRLRRLRDRLSGLRNRRFIKELRS